jgi:hypothetical protein
MRDMDILRSASDYHLSAQQLVKIVTTGLSAKLLPALPPPQPGKLKKKLPRQTSVPNIRHIIAGGVRRIIATGGSGPYPVMRPRHYRRRSHAQPNEHQQHANNQPCFRVTNLNLSSSGSSPSVIANAFAATPKNSN